MKRIKYSLLRRITFAVYLLTTIIFCLYLIRLGDREVSKAKSYTDTEKQNVITLLSCREHMNSVETAFEKLLLPEPAAAANFAKEVSNLRKAADTLVKLEQNRSSRSFMPDSQLNSLTVKLHSLAITLQQNFREDDKKDDKAILIREDFRAAVEMMHAIRTELQARLNVELNHVENWQNQSLFFFERLEMLLVSFFILATVFSFTAFAVSGAVLKKYLERISFGANQISSGRLSYRFNDTTKDIVGNVMRDFDAMAVQLQKQTQMMENINKELHEKAEELSEMNMHKDKFLANMSHELRTPLNSIIGFSDLLIAKSTSLPPEKIENFATKILTAAEHLLELISDLLEIAKVDAGVLTMNIASVDINTLLKSVVEMLQPIADKKELQLNLSLPDDSITVDADKRLIRQVLINIINNALKYTKAGEVSITLYDEKDNSADSTPDRVKIEIRDTGIGISRKDSLLIFKDFHRVEQGLTSNFEGVGLGLTLSKRIIELHKGEITVQSELKKGSIFTILLPKEKK